MRQITIAALAIAALVSSPRAHADVDLRAQASHLLVAMEGDAHRVANLLRVTRASRAAEAKCVSGYLSQIDASVRHGRDDVADIRAALSVNDQPSALRAMGFLESRREAARTASFGADSCVAPAISTQARDQTVVHVISPQLPSDRVVFAR